ncbi:hypothetical protein GCM10007425_24340 [Lysinibacillus alkalisoli]|uniref:Uncharacterized protein n=1 Tax=Lysinibacillus alkalisoli TaxID=1911548 RepID=A0A917G963_9BACI|nr:hypothetical protein [Lysinibacillus alkalisoli]GGG28901.1 hypothetical protein GCM10007425_24340 [Lysinibacillus alkalisoli]
MHWQRFKFVIPMMVIVAVSSVYMLNEFHPLVPKSDKTYIVIGATVVAGVISYFLFPQASEKNRNDYWPDRTELPFFKKRDNTRE